MSTYIPRYTRPDDGDENYINTAYGGKNKCIVRRSNGSVLPNCTGYAWGRCLELNGSSTLPTTNASTWYSNSPNYNHGTEPKLGAIVCYGGGSYGGAGHVAVIESINADGTVITSESNYSGGSRFFVTRTLDPDNNYYIQADLKFQGLIYLGDWDSGGDEPPTPVDPPGPVGKKRSILLLMLKVLSERGII